MGLSPDLRWDRQLVELFLEGFNKRFGCAFIVKEWPEETEKGKQSSRQSQVIDAIAKDSKTGETLAIEPTLLPPFTQQKWYDQRFKTIFGDLEYSPTLVVPGFHVTIWVPAAAIPEKGDFDKISKLISEWIRTNITGKIAGEGS